MNATDLARLELAKRAFQATQPGDAEVQTGVRRARLALDRPKPRSRWFSKGLVFVVLAVGSLAYAKPQALGELVEKVLPRDAANAGKHLAGGPASTPVEAAVRLDGVTPTGHHARGAGASANSAPTRDDSQTGTSAIAEAAAASAAEAAAAPPSAAEAPRDARAPSTSGQAQVQALNGAVAAAVPATGPRSKRPAAGANAAGSSESPAGTPTIAVSDWGRVGQALARGDDSAALAALDGLSESDDQRTRDKADLGRAQLLMAHGDQDKACSLARSLTHRRAGGRIERQAQLLLKSCGR
jgi:hypothetical protein